MTYVAPNAVPAPLEAQGLLRVIQQWIAALTGLDGDLVRPRWQAEPPNMPPANPAWNPASLLPASNAWCAVGVGARPADTFPAVIHDGVAEVDHLYKNETLECLASFYDVGYDGLADNYASLFRDGATIAQNREALILIGIFPLDFGEPVAVPILKSERWVYRVDVPFRLRRTSARDYPVPNVKIAVVTIETEAPVGGPVIVNLNVHQ